MNQFFYDGNNNPNGKSFSDDEPVDSSMPWPQVYFDTTTQGWILSKKYIPEGPSTKAYHYFHNVNGDVLGGYYFTSSNVEQIYDAAHHLGRNPNHFTPEVSNFTFRNVNYPIGKTALTPKGAKLNSLGWDEQNYPSLGPKNYIVEYGDSLEAIAQKTFGDINAAVTIAKINGLVSMGHRLRPGQVLRLPQYIPRHNKAENNRPYHEFKSIMLGK